MSGLYIAAQGMLAEQVRQDQLANDLANASTPGYKSETSVQQSFGAILLSPRRGWRHDPDRGQDRRRGDEPRPGAAAGDREPARLRHRRPGLLRRQDAAGVQYTRNGQFSANAQGLLVDQFGNPVLSQTGGRSRSGSDGRVSRTAARRVQRSEPDTARQQQLLRHGRRSRDRHRRGWAARDLRGGRDHDDGQDDGVAGRLSGRAAGDPDHQPDDAGERRDGRARRRCMTMLQGLFAAASGMEAQQTQLDAIANDVSNVDTPGYQSEEVGFREPAVQQQLQQCRHGRDRHGSGACDGRLQPGRGQLEPTGNPLDVAIGGEGYLQVRQSDGTVGLTRNGTLQLSRPRAQLTTDLGHAARATDHGARGHAAATVAIASDGTVRAPARKLGKIGARRPFRLPISCSGRRGRVHPDRRPAARSSAATGATLRAGLARAVERRHQRRDDDDDDRRAGLRPRQQSDPVSRARWARSPRPSSNELHPPTRSHARARRRQPRRACRRSASRRSPRGVRSGNAAAKSAYTEALQFEQVLVNQLTQQLTPRTLSSTTARAATRPTAATTRLGSAAMAPATPARRYSVGPGVEPVREPDSAGAHQQHHVRRRPRASRTPSSPSRSTRR